MECSRCSLQQVIYAFTQANLENSMGRMKMKQIIAAVNNLKVCFKELCDRCKGLPSETNRHVEGLKAAWNAEFGPLVESVKKDSADLLPAVQRLQAAFQSVCLTCSRVSNDDNPSNHGQTFVSLDSGNCQADSGRAKTTHTDDNVVQSRADWIGLHKSPDVGESVYGMSPEMNAMIKDEPHLADGAHDGSSSLLPPDVEDMLREQFSNFVQLDIVDKILLSCLMSGMNVAEFAKMNWFPYSLVDPKTRKIKPITKQAAHARWINIISKFPVFMSVALSSTRESTRERAKMAAFLRNPNGDKGDSRFKNGRLTGASAKEEAKRLEREKRERERRRESEVRRKKGDKSAKPKRKAAVDTLLPGLEAIF